MGKPMGGSLRESVNRDARKVHDILVGLMGKSNWDNSDYETYTLNTHGIKSALASIANIELSSLAATLEQAGKSKDRLLIQSKTLTLIKGLKELIESTSLAEEKTVAGQGSEDLLFQQLATVNEACARYNKKDVRDALNVLNNYTWPQDTAQLIAELNACLPHSEFDRMVGIVKRHPAG